MSIRLLIVDDHALVRAGLVRLLSAQADIDVVGVAADGAAALAQIDALGPDVVLLDLALPDVDGLEIASRVALRRPSSRVLVLSMHCEAEYARAALDRGASGLVSKAASQEELVEAIRAVARGKTLPAREQLSPREVEVLRWVADGKSNEEIARLLSIQVKTVEGYCQRLMDELGIHTRAGVVAYGRRTFSNRS
jgi:DNA-binding NarL/FixJ family response regulator